MRDDVHQQATTLKQGQFCNTHAIAKKLNCNNV